jgi:hypothetical protein
MPYSLAPAPWKEDLMNARTYLIACVTLFTSVACFAAQPNMHAALASLEQAKETLQRATPDKGGHRVKAIKAVDAAIAEVKAGIEYDRTYVSPQEKAKK